MQTESAVSKAFSEEDEAMIKAMKVVYWITSENLPLTKYESLMQLLKDLGVLKIVCLKVGERLLSPVYACNFRHRILMLPKQRY